MLIGIPRERKKNELRVAMFPEHCAKLIATGHSVLVESDAGKNCGFSNDTYVAAGCEIAPTLEELWRRSAIIVKVKEPAPEEYPFMRKSQVVFSFLHPAASLELTEQLLASQVIGVDYDLVRDSSGALPILAPMSSIAGTLSVHIGARFLLSHSGGMGLLLGSTLPAAPRVRVLILGAGTAGQAALDVAHSLGAVTTILDINKKRLRDLSIKYKGISTAVSSAERIQALLPHHDLIIGAALVPGARAPILITREDLSLCTPGSVFVDIAIDQGGVAETSRVQSIENPSYEEGGVTHVCIPNMPAMVAKTASQALANATLPYLMELLTCVKDNSWSSSEAIRNAVVCSEGKLTNQAIAESFGMTWDIL